MAPGVGSTLGTWKPFSLSGQRRRSTSLVVALAWCTLSRASQQAAVVRNSWLDCPAIRRRRNQGLPGAEEDLVAWRQLAGGYSRRDSVGRRAGGAEPPAAPLGQDRLL